MNGVIYKIQENAILHLMISDRIEKIFEIFRLLNLNYEFNSATYNQII